MTEFIERNGHYFRVKYTTEDALSRTRLVDRPWEPPRNLFKRLVWHAKDQWFKIQARKPENDTSTLAH